MNDKKFQKRKERERNKKRKILLQREAFRKKLKIERKLQFEEKKSFPKLTPINKAELEKNKNIIDEEVKLKLEHNAKILQALQEAEDAEKAGKPVENLSVEVRSLRNPVSIRVGNPKEIEKINTGLVAATDLTVAE